MAQTLVKAGAGVVLAWARPVSDRAGLFTVVRSLTLRDFNAMEVARLYQQHTQDTGQIFTTEAIATAFDLTQGQPWLVNALAKEIVEEMVMDTMLQLHLSMFTQPKKY
ncbi:MAG: hypothetical protein HC903_06745 [Methylacidiphilales bacterium]|nr:hypothetical protein [Candidatus Methylacidiphilales bacterium]